MKKILICVIGFLIVLSYSFPTIAGLDDGLVAYWSFDNCDVRDDSGNGHNGVIYGTPECVIGISGKAFKFDGYDYIKVSSRSDMRVEYFSLAFWIMPSTCEEDTTGIISARYQHSSVEASGFEVLISNQGLGSSIMTYQWNNFGSRSRGSICDNRWHFFVFTWDGVKARTYEDGELVDEIDPVEDLGYPDYNYGAIYWNGEFKQDFLIGKAWHPLYGDNMFRGILDEIRYYNRALNREEIEELYRISSSDDRYNEGFEAGKQYCIENPSACGISDRYEEGIEEGKRLCRENPLACGIDLECDSESTSNTCEASFNMFTNTLHVPCLRMGESYWLDLSLIGSNPVQLEVTAFGKNE